jgi:hypothetical protein
LILPLNYFTQFHACQNHLRERVGLFLEEPVMLRIVATFILLVSLTSIASAQGKSAGRTWLNGVWEGTGYQIDTNQTWAMKLMVRGRRYRIEYPSLKCGGRWIPININPTRARFVEKITLGIETCTDNGNVVIEKLSARQIAYRYSNRGTREVTASSILNKTK